MGELSSLFGYEWFFFLCLEYKSGHTVYYIDFSRLKRTNFVMSDTQWYFFYCDSILIVTSCSEMNILISLGEIPAYQTLSEL